jgi:hypothetical protein
MSDRPKEGVRIRAARVGETPTDTERFLDNFGTLLQVCAKGDALKRLGMVIGPNNVEGMIEEYRKACVEFFGTEHEFFREQK